MTRSATTVLCLSTLLALACSDDTNSNESENSSETRGDGDGDPSGDGDGDPAGDGDPTGDGDGDSGDGDGDGDPTGDGDGDSGDGDGDLTGDGDGDLTGDGDGDGACLEPGEEGPLASENLDATTLSEFFADADFATVLTSQEAYADYFEGQAPADFATEWLVFIHPGSRPFGTDYALLGLEVDGACSLSAQLSTTALGDDCDNFEYTRSGPLLARTPIAFDPASAPELVPAPGLPFNCTDEGAAAFESCDESSWCAPGLICAGITRFQTGMCMDASLRGTFDTGVVDLAFSDDMQLEATLEADGLATVDMDVIINLELEHADPSALTITLTNPSGNEVMVWNQEPTPYTLPWYPTPGSLALSRVPVGFSGDEDVNGTWTLIVTSSSPEPGTVVRWGLEIMSRFD